MKKDDYMFNNIGNAHKYSYSKCCSRSERISTL